MRPHSSREADDFPAAGSRVSMAACIIFISSRSSSAWGADRQKHEFRLGRGGLEGLQPSRVPGTENGVALSHQPDATLAVALAISAKVIGRCA
jgi:hypothetical protein